MQLEDWKPLYQGPSPLPFSCYKGGISKVVYCQTRSFLAWATCPWFKVGRHYSKILLHHRGENCTGRSDFFFSFSDNSRQTVVHKAFWSGKGSPRAEQRCLLLPGWGAKASAIPAVRSAGAAGAAWPLLGTAASSRTPVGCPWALAAVRRGGRIQQGARLSWGTDASRGEQGVVSCSSPELDGVAMGMGWGSRCGQREGVCTLPRSCCSCCRWWRLSKTGIWKPLTRSSPTEGTELLLTKGTASHCPLGRSKVNASSHLCEPIQLCKRFIFSRYATRRHTLEKLVQRLPFHHRHLNIHRKGK